MATSSKLVTRSFKTGAWIFLLVCLGHTAGQLTTDFGNQAPAVAETFATMTNVQGMEGSPRTLLDFYRGDSYGLGLLCFAFGALCLLVARELERHAMPYPRSLLGFAAAIAWAMLALSVRFFPAPPIVFLVVASAAFTLATVRANERA